MLATQWPLRWQAWPFDEPLEIAVMDIGDERAHVPQGKHQGAVQQFDEKKKFKPPGPS
jgi:hypothetical protein